MGGCTASKQTIAVPPSSVSSSGDTLATMTALVTFQLKDPAAVPIFYLVIVPNVQIREFYSAEDVLPTGELQKLVALTASSASKIRTPRSFHKFKVAGMIKASSGKVVHSLAEIWDDVVFQWVGNLAIAVVTRAHVKRVHGAAYHMLGVNAASKNSATVDTLILAIRGKVHMTTLCPSPENYFLHPVRATYLATNTFSPKLEIVRVVILKQSLSESFREIKRCAEDPEGVYIVWWWSDATGPHFFPEVNLASVKGFGPALPTPACEDVKTTEDCGVVLAVDSLKALLDKHKRSTVQIRVNRTEGTLEAVVRAKGLIPIGEPAYPKCIQIVNESGTKLLYFVRVVSEIPSCDDVSLLK